MGGTLILARFAVGDAGGRGHAGGSGMNTDLTGSTTWSRLTIARDVGQRSNQRKEIK